jgi:hypothetical protein
MKCLFAFNSENYHVENHFLKQDQTDPLKWAALFKAASLFWAGTTALSSQRTSRIGSCVRYGGTVSAETGYTLYGRERHACRFVLRARRYFIKLAEPLVISMAKRAYDTDLQNLKEMLEAQAV